MSNKRIYPASAPPDFQRWVPTPLDDTAKPAATTLKTEPLLDYLSQQDRILAAEQAEAEAAAQSVDELNAIQEEARQRGFLAGLKEGHLQGGFEAEQMQTLLVNSSAALEQLHANLASHVLKLALDLSRHVLRSELTFKPEHIIPLVQEMVQALPLPGGHPKLHLQPDDADLVRKILGPELDALGWKIVPDHVLQRGDCMIETHQGELNATLTTRWQQLCNSLGVVQALDDEAT